MKFQLLASACIATSFAVPAAAQISVYLGVPPPPLRYEVQPPMPYPDAYWLDGYWMPQGGRYRWMPGRWDHAPYPNAYWNHPHYDRYRQGWRYDPGHWDTNDHGQRGHDNGNGHGRGNGEGDGNGRGNGHGNGHGNENGNGHGNGNGGHGDH